MFIIDFIKRELEDYKDLLRNIPSLPVSLFLVSVVAMNLLANKELFSSQYLALDCGFTISWVAFLCMDMICKRYGPKAAAKISVLAIATNLACCGIFKLLSLTPGMWGEYYSTGMIEVNEGLNATIGGCWYVVFGSALAMFVSAVVNSFVNWSIAKRLTTNDFKAFAKRSFISTGIAQFIDNLVFATVVSHVFFGWSWLAVVTCSLTGALLELACEVVFSPIGYKISKDWEKNNIGQDYLEKYQG